MPKAISGFSKLTKDQKISWLADSYFENKTQGIAILEQYWNSDRKLQQLHDEFIENTISNYYLPFAIAPNFLINGQYYTIPMAIEESSVVAAASKAAKYWSERGGFKTEVRSVKKVGQVHFSYTGSTNELFSLFNSNKAQFFEDSDTITSNMKRRGGGILEISLKDKTADLENYYQLHATFDTQDAMGANFINSCLEQFATTLQQLATQQLEGKLEVIMSILSNYVPECIVKAEVSCAVNKLLPDEQEAQLFAKKFVQACTIAEIEPFRAVTHNKGIMNGVDAVVLATGNDFRAVEAAVHAYASRSGQYTALSHAKIDDDVFTFSLEIPLALGTVGGLTSLHPLVKLALDILGRPSAKELMQIVASVGLAQNFAAIKSLTTTGIQQGHMKMHLMNILNQFEANSNEKEILIAHFKNNTVSHSAVIKELNKLRVQD